MFTQNTQRKANFSFTLDRYSSIKAHHIYTFSMKAYTHADAYSRAQNKQQQLLGDLSVSERMCFVSFADLIKILKIICFWVKFITLTNKCWDIWNCHVHHTFPFVSWHWANNFYESLFSASPFLKEYIRTVCARGETGEMREKEQESISANCYYHTV